MTTTTPAAPPRDPSLAALVPRPSPWRHAVVVVVALALLVTVGVVGVRTRISLSDDGGAGQLTPDSRILEEHHVVSTGWPGLTMTAVTPATGTRLLEAWLVPRSARITTRDESLAALVDALEQDGAQFRLPRTVEPGLEYRLVLSSEVLSCDALPTGPNAGSAFSSTVTPAGAAAEPGTPSVHLRTALGTQLDGALFWTGWDRDTLETWGSCPD